MLGVRILLGGDFVTEFPNGTQVFCAYFNFSHLFPTYVLRQLLVWGAVGWGAGWGTNVPRHLHTHVIRPYMVLTPRMCPARGVPDLPDAFRQILQQLHCIMSRSGFVVNFARGTTSVVVTFRGPKSARLNSAAGRKRLDTTWFWWSKNQKITFKIIKKHFFRQKNDIKKYKKI